MSFPRLAGGERCELGHAPGIAHLAFATKREQRDRCDG
jgi:hypothetical protein